MASYLCHVLLLIGCGGLCMAGNVKQTPYLINDIDCWRHCGSKGGSCPGFCGADGYCCSKGYNDCIKIYRDVATSNYHTCVRGNPPANLGVGAASDVGMNATYTFKPFSISKGKLLTNIYKLGKQYKVTFAFYPTSFTKGWHNVFHMSNGDVDNIMYGDRIPGVWFSALKPVGNKHRIYICSAVSGNKDYCYHSTPYLRLKKWHNFEISQINMIDDVYIYTVKVDGQVVSATENTKPAEFRKVKVYASDPWYNPQPGLMKNLKIETTLPSAYSLLNQITIKKSQLLTTLPVLRKQYSLSFQVKPTTFGKSWGSVIHFTQGGNNGKYGDRTPAVWFRPGVSSLHICSAVNGQRNYCQNPSRRFTKGGWISVKIVQFKSDSVYRYQIFINNKMIHDTINKKPEEFKNVKVYVGDPWYKAQDGVIRNIIIKGTQ